jgi:hypothetical protein
VFNTAISTYSTTSTSVVEQIMTELVSVIEEVHTMVADIHQAVMEELVAIQDIITSVYQDIAYQVALQIAQVQEEVNILQQEIIASWATTATTDPAFLATLTVIVQSGDPTLGPIAMQAIALASSLASSSSSSSGPASWPGYPVPPGTSPVPVPPVVPGPTPGAPPPHIPPHPTTQPPLPYSPPAVPMYPMVPNVPPYDPRRLPGSRVGLCGDEPDDMVPSDEGTWPTGDIRLACDTPPIILATRPTSMGWAPLEMAAAGVFGPVYGPLWAVVPLPEGAPADWLDRDSVDWFAANLNEDKVQRGLTPS